LKKLLLLGGARYLLPVIKAGREQGYHIVTCDYLPDNFAHKYSDEYFNVSVTDKDAVLRLAHSIKADGILSFACDPGVTAAAYAAEKLGLPSGGPYESVEILQNKGKFRKFLTENGFVVPHAKKYTSYCEFIKDADFFDWPVIVKPTDSAGSKGVSKADSPDNIREKIEYALKFSLSGEFIVEDFIEKKGFSSDSDSFSVGGELKFVSFSSQRFDERAENPYTPSAYSWPSSISDAHQKELKSEIQRLLSLLNMKTSVYNIEARESVNGKAYIMELSPRGGGNRLCEMLKYATGVDLITNCVRAAVGDSVSGIAPCEYNGSWAEVILHSDRAGRFDKLYIAPSIAENVVETDLWIDKGDLIGGFSAANEAVGTLVLRFSDNGRLCEVMDRIDEFVKVMVE